MPILVNIEGYRTGILQELETSNFDKTRPACQCRRMMTAAGKNFKNFLRSHFHLIIIIIGNRLLNWKM